MKYLGIDYGSKRIGLAVSDREGKVAFPREVVVNKGQKTLAYIAMFCTREKIEEIVLGESLNFKMQPNQIQVDIANFKLQIENLTGLGVRYQSEVFSSAEAARQTDKINLDAGAAAIILQSFLDKRKEDIM